MFGEWEQKQNFRPSPDFKPLNQTVDERKNIYLIVKNLESSYWKMIEGAKAGGDNALYIVKENGRNGFGWYQAER